MGEGSGGTLRIERWDQRNPSGDWWNRVVFLWAEDDAVGSRYDESRTLLAPNPKGHDERARLGMWAAITGGERRPADIIEKHDYGDTLFVLYRNGFVHSESYDGEAIGIVAEVRMVPMRTTPSGGGGR